MTWKREYRDKFKKSKKSSRPIEKITYLMYPGIQFKKLRSINYRNNVIYKSNKLLKTYVNTLLTIVDKLRIYQKEIKFLSWLAGYKLRQIRV